MRTRAPGALALVDGIANISVVDINSIIVSACSGHFELRFFTKRRQVNHCQQARYCFWINTEHVSEVSLLVTKI